VPSFTFTSPEGQKYTVNGPDGATPGQAFAILQGYIGGQKTGGRASQTKSWDEDVLPSLNEGLNRGADALLGLPGDLWHGARYLANKAINAAAGLPGNRPEDEIHDILPTSESLRKRREGITGPGYQPQSVPGKFAQTIGEFLPAAAAVPEKTLGGALVKYGVIPGAAAEAAGEATEGTPLEPYARVAGAVGAGVAPTLGKVAQGAAKTFLEPFSEEGRQNVAARGLRDAFTDPKQAQIDLEAAKATQQPGSGMGEIVPGSRPTTGQLTGDQGALQLERSLANENRTAFHENEYGTGADQQNAARSTALGGIQPTGTPADVSDQIRKGLADIEASQDRAVQDAQGRAQAASAGIGRGATPESQGAAIRSSLQGARDEAKANERKLWSAIDPDGTLALPADPVTSAANQISQAIARSAKPMSGEEAAIFDTAANLPSITPFNEITALRSRISTAMREEMRSAGSSPTYARLTQLRGAVENAINNAAMHKAAVDEAAVAAGGMDARDSLRARVDGFFNAETAAGQGPGQGDGRSVASAGAASSADAFGSGGAPRQGDGRLRNGAGGQGVPGQVSGNKVYYPSGSLDVNHEVVPLSDLVTSHDADFTVNSNYPQELQPRARETAPARDQVNQMSARLQPARLGPSPEANSGAPIVGPDNVVESGNGRTLAIAKAYKAGRGEKYRQWLQDQGHDVEGIDQPVLIARRKTDLSPADRVAFTHSANTASGLRMNAAEQAAADAKLITPDALEGIEDGSRVNSEGNRGFVRSFVSQLPAAERGGMLDAQGNLSQAGVRRLEAAMSARAYGDGDFISKAFDAADSNIRGLAGALTDAAGSWMRMRQAAREGVIDAAHDITTDLMNAARAVIRARDSGRPVSEILNQADMFGGEASSEAKNLLLNAKGNLGSREQIAARLQRYATEAQKNLAAPSLFGDVVEPSQVLRTTLKNEGAEAIEEPAPESAALKPALQANMDEGAAQRLRAASAATKERAQTFDQGPVGDVLRQRSGSQDYRLPDSAIPGKVWVPGPRGAQTVQSYGRAAGSRAAIQDAAAESLRREAMTPEGIIDPGKFASWKKRYADAIRALPADVQKTFENAGSASNAYEEAAAARKAAIDASQTGMAKRLAGLTNSQDITRTVGAIFGSRNAVEQMRDLANKLRGSPDAMAGLKKAVADHIAGLATGTTEAGASGVNKVNASAFQKFVARNASVLQEAGFTEGQISIMRALANDLQRSQRTMQATALPASPNTAADVMGAMRAAAKEGGKPSLLSKILAGVWTGGHAGPQGAVLGGAAAIGEHLTRAMRGAGLAKARDIVQAGILDPEIGRQLLRRASELPDAADERALAKAIAKKPIFVAPGISASVGNSSPQDLPASVGYGLKRLNSALTPTDAQSLQEVTQARSPLGEQIRSSLDKFGRAATVMRGSPSPQNSVRFMLAARNLSTNLSDAGIDVSPENIATVGSERQ
jgi:ddrB-like ParB superfamily domain